MKTIAILSVSLLLSCTLFADEPKNLLKPMADVKSWRLEEHEAGKGNMAADKESITFTATEIDGTNWHVQVFQTDLDLKEGQEYVLKFKIKSPASRAVSVVAMIDEEDWHEIGLHEDLTTQKEFREHQFRFRAIDVAEKKNRVGFVLGDAKGSIIVEDMTLSEAAPR